MEDDSIQSLRENNRNRIFLNRKKLKDEETDIRRSLSNLQLNPTDVTAIANKLKTKSSILASELILLQNALVDDPRNIELVLNVHGALRGLVRELTGHDVNKQIASCGCLCNISLGDAKTGCTVAKAAGAYLIAALNNLTTQLAATCAWSLGNIAGSGPRACDIILAQGALPTLCDVTHAHTRAPAVYVLTHIAYTMKDDLSVEHLQKMVQTLSTIDLDTEASHLLFILSCHKDFSREILPTQFIDNILENFMKNLDSHINNCLNVTKDETMCCNVLYLVRVLANLNNTQVYWNMLDRFVEYNLVQNLKKLLAMEDESVLWLLGNMLNCCGDSVFFQ